MTAIKRHRIGWIVLIALVCIIIAGLTFSGCTEKKANETKTKAKKVDKKSDPLFDEVISLEEYPAWIHKYLETRKWKVRNFEPMLTKKILNESIELGSDFMRKNQKPAGNFNYEWDWVKDQFTPGDNQVRQAGALWGVSLMYLHDPNSKNKAVLDKGLKFFLDTVKEGPDEVPGSLTVAYPGDSKTSSGTVALVALAIVEYFRADDASGNKLIAPAYRAQLKEKLDGFVKFLAWMRLDNKHFSKDYSLLTKQKKDRYSPYFDGETMLCLVKAAKYCGYKELIPMLEDSAMVLAKEYTVDEWRKNRDSDQTKGFFQWSCMTFWEYQDAGWKNKEVFQDYVIAMSWWMIHTHRTLKRGKGTGYAYEGILHSYQLAKQRNMKDAVNDIAYTIDRAMYKLITWQVEGPLASENKYLVANKDKVDDLAIGGFMNHKRQAPLRIDVTQHTLHASILTRQYMFGDVVAAE